MNSSVWNYLYPGYEPSPERIQEGQLEIILTCFWAWSVVLLPLLCSPLNNKKVYWNPLCTSVSRSYLECLDNEQFGLEACALRSFFLTDLLLWLSLFLNEISYWKITNRDANGGERWYFLKGVRGEVLQSKEASLLLGMERVELGWRQVQFALVCLLPENWIFLLL